MGQGGSALGERDREIAADGLEPATHLQGIDSMCDSVCVCVHNRDAACRIMVVND